MRMLRRRFPDEPFRQRLGAMAEHLRRTRGALTEARMPQRGSLPLGRRLSWRSWPSSPTRSSRPGCARRLGRGGRAALAGGDVRLPSRLARGAPARGRPRMRRWPPSADGGDLAGGAGRSRRGVSAAEVLATFRAMADVQRRYGFDACRRYVISFTREASDVLAVLDLAALAGEALPRSAVTSGFAPGTARTRRRAAARVGGRIDRRSTAPRSAPRASLPIGATWLREGTARR